MTNKRILAVMLTVAFLLCNLPSALAASAATKVPTLRFQGIQRKGVQTAHSMDIGVNASVSGFLTLWLMDSTGTALVRNYYDGVEIHSKVNYFNISAFDNAGAPLAPGSYQLCATMVNQYGTETAKTATATLNVRASKDVPMSASAIAAAQATESAAADNTAQPENSQQTANAGAAASASAVAYASGKGIIVGEEGFQIGVGVADYAPADGSYWGLTADASDAEIWAALIRPLTSVNVDEKESSYIYDSPYEGRKQLGTVSGLSQGLHVVAERQDGWSLVEAYRNEDAAFVRGYIKTSRLKSVDVNQSYGIVIDKAAQRLTVYRSGERIGSCLVTTGLSTVKYLARETAAGEFMTVTRRGTIEYYNSGNWSKYAIRINGNVNLQEIPTTKKGGKDYTPLLSNLGAKATRGTIGIASAASEDGGINAEWIWNMTDKNKKVKVLILDDKPRSSVPVAQ